MSNGEPLGLVGVFASPQPMVEAARQLHALGIEAVEAYTPYPVEALGEQAHAGRPTALPWIMAAGALVGACCGYFIQYWDEWLNYPLNVGGRPYNSWPAFTVGAFEVTLLFAVTAGFFGLWFACRLPRLYDPKVEDEVFDRASTDRFVLRVETGASNVPRDRIRRVFEQHGAEQIVEVAA
ncbi:MAG TPA: DUF3341 domain-containing protein [Roseiarcus sp.]|nr:DUF3341 domain-containing protein [Roseiarcus sp.]